MAGIKYKKLCTLCIGDDPHDLPIFAKFMDVYMVHQHKPIAYVRVYISTYFNAHILMNLKSLQLQNLS